MAKERYLEKMVLNKKGPSQMGSSYASEQHIFSI
jgi:hypothetical protein